MPVAFDADSNVASGTGNLEWTHTPVGTPKGVAVMVLQPGPQTPGFGEDQVVSVTYGGVTMTRILAAQLTTGGEQGVVYKYFLGSGIPTGPQTVKVTVKTTLGPAAPKRATATTVTATGNTEVVASGSQILDSTANPSVTLAVPEGQEAFVLGGLCSGHELAANVTPNASYTEILEWTGGTSAMVMSHLRRTANTSGGSTVVSWTATAENTVCAAMAIAEVASKTVELKVSISSTSSVTAGLARTRILKAAIASSTTLAAKLTRTRLVKAAIASTASILAKLEVIGKEARPDDPSTRVHVRQAPPLALHSEAETPNGRFYRWGKDEPRPENIPSGRTISTSIPGGFDTESQTLPRKPGVDYSDLERLTTLRAIGAGGEVASEVRLERAPRTSGDQFSIGPEAKGWFAHLGDDPTAAEIYRDIDLASWIGPGRAEQNALETANFPPTGGSEVTPDVDSGLPSLRLFIDGAWASPGKPIAEAWFDAGSSAVVASVYYDFSGNANTGFLLIWGSGPTDVSATEFSADLFTATAGTGTATPSTPRRYFQWQWYFKESPAGNDGARFACDLRRLAVEGNHGLPKQGTEPEAGFLASDIVADAVFRWAPLLRYSTGSTGTIRPSSFVIPHLSFKDKTTALAIVEGANAYELRPYAVWENRTFHYYDWGDRGRKWRTRVAPSQLSETGPTVERLRNGVVMEWQDVDGTTKSAGPIGSGCDVEDETLEDKDPENPANQRGLRMWGEPIPIGISVEKEVLRVGALYLARLKETDTSGQMQIVGTCEDDKGVVRPAWQVRAGDTIVPVDASDTRERRIIRTSYNEDTFTNTIDLDAPPDGTPDLLAQMGASISDLGL